MTTTVVKQEGETWRQLVERVAKTCGLENQCLKAFDRSVVLGCSEDSAAWAALYAWDCIDWARRSGGRKPELGDD